MARSGGRPWWPLGLVLKSSEVTTPNLPWPAPRSAQNRSLAWPPSHAIADPSARTTRAASSESQVRPWVRPRIPSPPPRVSPAIPTPGPQPAGMVRPWPPSASYTSPSRAPAPIVATPPVTDTDRIGVTSMTIPAPDERPAKQWPPLRGTAGRPDQRATARASATSAAVAQNTTACGLVSWKRAMAGLRAWS